MRGPIMGVEDRDAPIRKRDYGLYSRGPHSVLTTALTPARARLKRALTLLLWHTVQRLDALLPRPIRFIVATALGELAFWLLPGKRAAALANMSRVLGQDAPAREVRAVAQR